MAVKTDRVSFMVRLMPGIGPVTNANYFEVAINTHVKLVDTVM